MNSHQFRHWLNTLAQIGGMSQMQIARWSNRKDIKHNEAYDHITADFMIEQAKETLNSMSPVLLEPKDQRKVRVISRDELGRFNVNTAHITDIGVCIHDFAMNPCELFNDCDNCSESFCMKGHKDTNDRLFYKRDQTILLLNKAKQAHNEGVYGAKQWIEHHEVRLNRQNKVCSILEDPSVPNGTFIRFSELTNQEGNGPSRLDNNQYRLASNDTEKPIGFNILLTNKEESNE
jgi:hypothetical protein